jgi:hypothetical protein
MGGGEGSGGDAGLSGLRACPDCGSRLVCNSGASAFQLCCDGHAHNGSRVISYADRYSCFGCGAKDFCVPCAEALPPSACFEQVTVRLRADDEADPDEEPTAGLGYVFRARSGRRVVSPAPLRDTTHRNCVPKERHQELAAQKEELERELQRCRRSQPVIPTPGRQRELPPSTVTTLPAKARMKRSLERECADLAGDVTAEQAARAQERRVACNTRKLLRIETSLQVQAAALRKALHERDTALAAEDRALKAQARVEESVRHKRSCFERMEAKLKKSAQADRESAKRVAAEADARAAAAEAWAEAKVAADCAVRAEAEAECQERETRWMSARAPSCRR